MFSKMSKNIFRLFLITEFLMKADILCQKFCETVNKGVDSAQEFNGFIHLFQNENVWSVHPNLTIEPKFFGKVDKIFNSPKLERIDGLVVVDPYGPKFLMIFIIKQNNYYWYWFKKCPQNDDNCVSPLSQRDSNDIPMNMNYLGGPLDDWFPKKIDDILKIQSYLFIFHEKFIRLLKIIEDPSGDWPIGPKIDIPFGGDLVSVNRIDAIFQLPKNGDIIILKDQTYCRSSADPFWSVFEKISRNEKITDLSITCQWKDWRVLFKCEKLDTTTQIPVTDSTQTMTETVTQVTDFPTLKVLPYTTQPAPSDYGLIYLLVLLIALSFFFLGTIFAFFVYCFVNKLSTTKTKRRMGQSNTVSVDNTSSVATIDSTSGQQVHRKTDGDISDKRTEAPNTELIT